MGKNLKSLVKNIYENDVVALQDEDEYFSSSLDDILKQDTLEVTKINRKNKKVKREERKKETQKLSEKLSTISVKSNCNKCKEVIYGELLHMIYHPQDDRMNPFFSYSCANCGHKGKRSDYSKSLRKDEFMRYYKIDD